MKKVFFLALVMVLLKPFLQGQSFQFTGNQITLPPEKMAQLDSRFANATFIQVPDFSQNVQSLVQTESFSLNLGFLGINQTFQMQNQDKIFEHALVTTQDGEFTEVVSLHNTHFVVGAPQGAATGSDQKLTIYSSPGYFRMSLAGQQQDYAFTQLSNITEVPSDENIIVVESSIPQNTPSINAECNFSDGLNTNTEVLPGTLDRPKYIELGYDVDEDVYKFFLIKENGNSKNAEDRLKFFLMDIVVRSNTHFTDSGLKVEIKMKFFNIWKNKNSPYPYSEINAQNVVNRVGNYWSVRSCIGVDIMLLVSSQLMNSGINGVMNADPKICGVQKPTGFLCNTFVEYFSKGAIVFNTSWDDDYLPKRIASIQSHEIGHACWMSHYCETDETPPSTIEYIMHGNTTSGSCSSLGLPFPKNPKKFHPFSVNQLNQNLGAKCGTNFHLGYTDHCLLDYSNPEFDKLTNAQNIVRANKPIPLNLRYRETVTLNYFEPLTSATITWLPGPNLQEVAAVGQVSRTYRVIAVDIPFTYVNVKIELNCMVFYVRLKILLQNKGILTGKILPDNPLGDVNFIPFNTPVTVELDKTNLSSINWTLLSGTAQQTQLLDNGASVSFLPTGTQEIQFKIDALLDGEAVSRTVAFVNNSSRNWSLDLFPNPTTEYIDLKLNDLNSLQGVYQLQIMNQFGQLVFSAQGLQVNNYERIDVKEFGPGLFNIVINYDQQPLTRIIQIQ